MSRRRADRHRPGHVDLACVNDAPVAVDDDAAGTEDVDLVIDPLDLLANDTDVDNVAADLSVNAVGSAAGGSVSINGDGDVVFEPDLNLCGLDVASFEYTVSDGELTDTGLSPSTSPASTTRRC